MSLAILRLVAAGALALAFTLVVPDASNAQPLNGNDGTGEAAGNSPSPIEAPAAPVNAPPIPSDEGASKAEPGPDKATPDNDFDLIRRGGLIQF